MHGPAQLAWSLEVGLQVGALELVVHLRLVLRWVHWSFLCHRCYGCCFKWLKLVLLGVISHCVGLDKDLFLLSEVFYFCDMQLRLFGTLFIVKN